MPRNTTTTRRHRTPTGDEALLAAEQQLTELRRKEADREAAGDHSDHDETVDAIAKLETLICKTAPDSLIGAAVKLRVLLDDLEAESIGEGDEESVRQILAVVEHVRGRDRAETDTATPVSCDKGASALEYALSDIGSLAELLAKLGEVAGEGHIAYLGGHLQDHYDAAQDAFCQIFGLGDYRSKAEGARS
jgi:hypothetical protein